MHLGIDFWKDFGGFLKANGGMLAPTSNKNRCQLRRANFWKNLVFPSEKQWFWRFRGSKLEVKIDEQSIKKWSQDGKASWDRFLMDFGGFLEASWEGIWSQDQSQEASKERWKNGSMLAPKSSKNRSQLRKAIFWKKLVFPKENQRFWGFRGSKLEVKIDEKSIKKWSQDGKASWHRFLMDLGGFLEASWEGKWSQDRDGKVDSIKMAKNSQQDALTLCDPRGPGPWGGPPLLGEPAPCPRHYGPPGL